MIKKLKKIDKRLFGCVKNLIDAVCAQKKDAAYSECLSTYFSVADKLKEELKKRDENKETL